MMSCYYPTTTIVIDDDIDFLKIITQHLGIADCIPHSSPKEAIKAISRQKTHQRIQTRIFKKTIPPEEIDSSPEDYALLVNTRGIHEEIYNQERFRDVSVIIVDYYMNETNGIEVCEALSNHPAKKILLTGGIDKESVAIEAFNKGLIHWFINKIEPDFPSKLKKAISTLKEAYFRDLTATPFLPLATRTTSLFSNPAYINFVRNLQDQYNAVEYYTIDITGSCIFLDEQGETTWFIVKHESEIEDFIKLAQDQEASNELLQVLRNRKMIPFFFSDKDYQQPISEWHKFLHSAQPLPSINAYYYSINNDQNNQLNKNEIAPYSSYRAANKNKLGN